MPKLWLLSLAAVLFFAAAAAADEPTTDAFGDPLPAGARARLGPLRWRTAPDSGVVGFADAKTIITANGANHVEAWDYPAGKPLRRFGEPQRTWTRVLAGTSGRPPAFQIMSDRPAARTALSGDGRTLINLSSDQVLRYWDPASGVETRQFKKLPDGVASLSLSPDGKSTAWRESDQSIHLWESETGKELFRLGPKSPVAWQVGGHSVFSPDGKSLAAALIERHPDFANVLYLWDTATGKELWQVRGPKVGIELASLAFAPDGKTLAWVAADGAVHITETATGKEVRAFAGFVPPAQLRPTTVAAALAFAPDGKVLAGRSLFEGMVRLFDPETGKETHQLGQTVPGVDSYSTALGFSPDGKALIAGGAAGELRFWDVATGKEIPPAVGHRAAVTDVAFSADSKTVLTRGNDHSLCLWDAATGKERERVAAGPGILRSAHSLDGRLTALALADGSVRLTEAVTGKERRRLTGDGRVAALALAPDGAALAVKRGERVRFFDVAGVKDERSFAVPQEPPYDDPARARDFLANFREELIFSPDGRTVAWLGSEARGTEAGETAKVLKLFDAATGEPRGTLGDLDSAMVLSAVFAPDGRTLAMMREDQYVLLYEVATGKTRGVFQTPRREPERPRAALGRGQIGLAGQTPGRGWLAFSADGKTLAVGCRDGRIEFYRTVDSSFLGQVRAHQGPVTALAFAPDGRKLASAGADGTVLLWPVEGLPRP